jgi:hypothetical protein
MIRLCSIVAVALLVLACDTHKVAGPVSSSGAGVSANRSADEPWDDTPSITALTWNVYVGAAVEHVLAARTPDEAVAFATREWANVRATNFPARAGSIAANIAARRPELVGLQELALFRTTGRPFEELATHVAYDFLQLVMDSLAARGLHYRVAAVDRTTDIQVPVIAGFDASGPILEGVRYTDGDAVLVRGDVRFTNPRSAVYTAHQPVTVAGVATGVFQGWSAVDAWLDGRMYRFVVTHLAGQEAAGAPNWRRPPSSSPLLQKWRPTILVATSIPTLLVGIPPTRPHVPDPAPPAAPDSWASGSETLPDSPAASSPIC